MFIIDGNDIKDLDDVISVWIILENEFEVGVYIFDVGSCIKKDDFIDVEVKERLIIYYLGEGCLLYYMFFEFIGMDMCSLFFG